MLSCLSVFATQPPRYNVLTSVRHCEGYLDEVIYIGSWVEHMKTLEEVFNRLREASLTLNLAKCDFG